MFSIKKGNGYFIFNLILLYISWHLFLMYNWDKYYTGISLIITGLLLFRFLPKILIGNFLIRKAISYLTLFMGIVAGIYPVLPAVASNNLSMEVFTLDILWTNLIILWSGSRILSILSEESAFKLWAISTSSIEESRITPISIGASIFTGFLLTMLFYTILLILNNIFSSDFSIWLVDVFFGNNVLYYIPVLVFWIIISLLISYYYQYNIEYKDMKEIYKLFSNYKIDENENIPFKNFRDTIYTKFETKLHHRPVKMVLIVLDAYQAQGITEADKAIEIIEVLQQESTQAGFNFTHSLINTLPLLGFLGTVVGISKAISEFGNILKDTNTDESTAVGLADSLSGLSVAFETTLIGLITSIISFIIISYLEKRDNEFMLEVELFCNRELLGRLKHEEI